MIFKYCIVFINFTLMPGYCMYCHYTSILLIADKSKISSTLTPLSVLIRVLHSLYKSCSKNRTYSFSTASSRSFSFSSMDVNGNKSYAETHKVGHEDHFTFVIINNRDYHPGSMSVKYSEFNARNMLSFILNNL